MAWIGSWAPDRTRRTHGESGDLRQEAFDDAEPNLSGPELYRWRLERMCEESARQRIDELEYRRSVRKGY